MVKGKAVLIVESRDEQGAVKLKYSQELTPPCATGATGLVLHYIEYDTLSFLRQR